MNFEQAIEVFKNLPVLNSGDETRDILSHPLTSYVPKRMINKSSFFKSNKIAPENTYVMLNILNFKRKYEINQHTTTDEIINVCNGFAYTHFAEHEVFGVFTSCNGRPLRPGFTLREFGIYHTNWINISPMLHGGSKDYRLYTHIRECELQVLKETKIWDVQLQWGRPTEDKILTNLINQYTRHYYGKEVDPPNPLKAFEDLFIMTPKIIHAASYAEMLEAIMIYIKLRIGDKSFMEYSSNIVQNIFTFFHEGIQADDESTFQSWMSQVREIFDNFETVRETKIYKKLYKILMYVMSLTLFQDAGRTMNLEIFEILHREAIKKGYSMGVSFAYSLIDTLTFLLERGYQCWQMGSLDPLFHSGKTYDAWINKATKVLKEAKYLNNPEPHGINMFTWLADLNECIDHGAAMQRAAGKTGQFEARIIRNILADLEICKAETITRRAAQQERPAPFSVLLFGGSSVAKSTFTKILYYQYGKIFDLPVGSEFKYTRNPVDEYWVNFNSTQWCVQLDDIAFMNPQLGQPDPSVMEMLQVINNVPFVPTQADLADKGRTPMRARFVIATTNTAHLNAYAYFANPLAVQRRFPYVITIEPKEEYAKDRVMLDGSKVPPIKDGEYPDYWKIKVQRVVPVGEDIARQTSRYEDVDTFDDIYKFVQWFSIAAKEHTGLQNKTMNCDDTMAKISVCDKCYLPTLKCECAIIQSEESITPWVQQVLALHHKREHREEVVELSWGEIILALFFNFLLKCYEENYFRCTRYIIGKAVETSVMAYLFKKYRYTKPLIQYVQVIGHKVKASMTKCMTLEATRLALPYAAGLIGVSFTMYAASKAMQIPNKKNKIRRAFRGVDDNIDKNCHHEQYDGTYKCEACANCEDCRAEKQTQGNISETIGRAPVAMKEENENVWYKDNYRLSKFDVSSATLSNMKLEFTEICERFARNSIALRVTGMKDGEIKSFNGKAFCVAGHIWVTNKHFFSEESGCFEVELIQDIQKDGVTVNMRIRLSQQEIVRVPNSDIVFIKIRNIPPRRNMISYFANSTLRGMHKGNYLIRNKDGSLEQLRLDAVTYQGVMHIKQFDDMPVEAWVGTPRRTTVNGECGSMFVSDTGFGPVILGFHFCLFQDGRVGIQALNRNLVQIYVDKMESEVVEIGEPMLSSVSVQRELVDLDVKSTVRYTPEGVAAVYGSFAGWKPRLRSAVKKTLICDKMLERGYSIKEGPPEMRSWEPWRINLLEMTKPVWLMDNVILDHCVESFFNDIMAKLDRNQLSQLHVLDDFTTINGAPGVTYIDKMNRNTSAGNPWKKGKKHYLTDLPPTGDWLKPVKVDDEIMDRVSIIIEKYQRGERAMPNFCGHLKDEATALEKIRIKKTRVFCGGPFDWSIVNRKYLLTIVRLIQNNKYIFEAAPGMITQSVEWQQLYDYLTKFGKERMVAGDYSKYDKRMPPALVLASFDLIKRICKEAGYSKEELLVVQGIAEDTAFPLTEFNGDLIEFYGTNPSGHPLTVIINSLANSLYLRYCYTVLNPEHHCRDFQDNVAAMTYGDDNAMGVSDRVPWFNHTSIQKALKDIDVKYTMADKEAESVPYIHIDQVSFLKRTWRFDEEVGAYLAPLEHDSINKMLTMCVASGEITPEQHAIEVISAAVQEYWFYGRATFEERSEMLKDVVKECNLGPYVQDSTFPTWDDLKHRYDESSKAILARQRRLRDNDL